MGYYSDDPDDPQNQNFDPSEQPQAQAPYQDIAYWQGKGYGTNDMFDDNGQMRPGWSRTANGYDFSQPAQTPPPGGAAPPTGGAPTGGGSLTRPFNEPPPQTPGAGIDYVPGTPRFKGPDIRVPDPFRAPSADDVFSDQGFQARMRGGMDRLQNWASAKGTLNDSGTAKSLIDYGQGEASQEYGNVWDRAYNAYNANVGSQYVLPWQEAFQNASAQNQNDMTGYSTQASAGQYQKNANYMDLYNQWLSKFNIFQDQRDSTFDKQYKLLTT